MLERVVAVIRLVCLVGCVLKAPSGAHISAQLIASRLDFDVHTADCRVAFHGTVRRCRALKLTIDSQFHRPTSRRDVLPVARRVELTRKFTKTGPLGSPY